VKALERLEKEIEAGSYSHAYLLIGGKDQDKELFLQKLIDAKGCLPVDRVAIEPLIEAGKKAEIKIEQIRGFIHEISLSSHGPCRFGIIRHADKMNTPSANALLKVLEEPAKNVILVLIANTEKILPTIRSRCRIYRLQSEMVSGNTFSYDSMIDGEIVPAFKQIESIAADLQAEIFLGELESRLREKLLETKSMSWLRAIELTQETKRRIRGNANPRLALESLILKIRIECKIHI